MQDKVCVYNISLYIHTPHHHLFREESVALMPGALPQTETAPGFAWCGLCPLKYVRTWVQTLCETGAVINEAYLHRRGVIVREITNINIFK